MLDYRNLCVCVCVRAETETEKDDMCAERVTFMAESVESWKVFGNSARRSLSKSL